MGVGAPSPTGASMGSVPVVVGVSGRSRGVVEVRAVVSGDSREVTVRGIDSPVASSSDGPGRRGSNRATSSSLTMRPELWIAWTSLTRRRCSEDAASAYTASGARKLSSVRSPAPTSTAARPNERSGTTAQTLAPPPWRPPESGAATCTSGRSRNAAARSRSMLGNGLLPAVVSGARRPTNSLTARPRVRSFSHLSPAGDAVGTTAHTTPKALRLRNLSMCVPAGCCTVPPRRGSNANNTGLNVGLTQTTEQFQCWPDSAHQSHHARANRTRRAVQTTETSTPCTTANRRNDPATAPGPAC